VNFNIDQINLRKINTLQLIVITIYLNIFPKLESTQKKRLSILNSTLAILGHVEKYLCQLIQVIAIFEI